jgi:hypothetical protein
LSFGCVKAYLYNVLGAILTVGFTVEVIISLALLVGYIDIVSVGADVDVSVGIDMDVGVYTGAVDNASKLGVGKNVEETDIRGVLLSNGDSAVGFKVDWTVMGLFFGEGVILKFLVLELE